MKMLKSLFNITGLLLLALFFLAIWHSDLNSFSAQRAAVREANDIAYALLIYKAKTGLIPNFDEPGWAFKIKDYLNPRSQASVTPQGEIKDTRGNTYEINRDGQQIDIFSYAMISPWRVNLDTGAVNHGKITFSQTIRSLYFGHLYSDATAVNRFFIPDETTLANPKTLVFDQQNYRFTIPGNWTERLDGEERSFSNEDDTKSFAIKIIKSDRSKLYFDDPDFLNPITSSLTTKGVLIGIPQSDWIEDLSGVYVDAAKAVPVGFVIYRLHVFQAYGYSYIFHVSKLNAKPWEDGELNTIVKSFAFLERTRTNR